MSIAQQDFSFMPDAALQQALQFAQRSNDTPKFLGLMAEMNKRKQVRSAAQGQQAGQEVSQQPTTIADQAMAGIANLPSGEHEYAGGGIVAFADGGRASEADLKKAYEQWQSVKTPWYMPTPRSNIEERAAEEAYTRMMQGGVGAGAQPPGNVPAAVAPQSPALNPRDPEMRARSAPTVQTPQPATPAPGAGTGSGSGITSLARRAATTSTTPAAPAPAETKILTAKEQMAADEALAKGRNDKVDAIYAKAEARDAARRAKLEDETKPTKGFFGAEMDPDTRRALRDAGIAMLQSKRPDALGGIGEGLAVAAKGYDESKQKRQARIDILDDADDKRQMAKLAAQQGNMELANKYSKQEADLRDQAAGRAFEEKKLASTERHQMTQADLQRQQIRQSAANAAHNPQLEIYRALGKGDVQKGFDLYTQGRGAGAADLASWKAYAADPAKLAALKVENPVLYAQVLSRIQGQLGSGTPAPAGAVRER